MKSNYKRLGEYIEKIDERNKDLKVSTLLGVSVSKVFLPSIANTVGTDFRKYKIVRENQFTYIPDTSRRGDKIGIALLFDHKEALVSQAYTVFKIIDHNLLDPEYLMMWFSRPEFDRYARYKSQGSVREIFDWEEMCNTELPVPRIDKQREIVAEYNTIVNHIKLNEQINQKLEETALGVYKQMFNDAKALDKVKLQEYVAFNPQHSVPQGKSMSYIEMADVQENLMTIKNTIKRPYTSGSKFCNGDTLLARITPCTENGKAAFVNCLERNEIAFGSTEFIVMRPKNFITTYWVYCLSKDIRFLGYAISSMVGSSGRQRVQSDYLKEYQLSNISIDQMRDFEHKVKPLFETIRTKTSEIKILKQLRELILPKMTQQEV